jgi:hypothetical protein
MPEPLGPGVFLTAALTSMALVTLALGIQNPELRFSLVIALAISGILVTGGYWIVRHLRERHG